MTKVRERNNGILCAIAVILMAILINSYSYAGTTVISDNFDGCWVSDTSDVSTYEVQADIIGDTTNGFVEKIYYDHALVGSNSPVTVVVKQLKLAIEPTVNANGRLGIGTSTVSTRGLDPFYSMAGLRYDLPENSVSMVVDIDYYNIRDKEGRLTFIIQNVVNGVIEWEEVWHVTGYKSWIDGWQKYSIDIGEYSEYIGGGKFNTLWIVGTGHGSSTNNGGFIEDIVITVESEDVEEVIEAIAFDEPIDEYEAEEQANTIADAVTDINEECPCDEDWGNHGEYVSCIADASNSFGYLYDEVTLQSAVAVAAQSSCGKIASVDKGKKPKHIHDMDDPTCSEYGKGYKQEAGEGYDRGYNKEHKKNYKKHSKQYRG